MLTTLAVDNYRSLRDLVVPLRRLTLVTGANGTGKSSLYRSLRLLARSARNGAIAALAREGGLPGTLWAGPDVVGRAVREGLHPVQGTVRRGPVGLRLGFSGDAVGYAVDFGLPEPRRTAFHLDPEIKRESVWVGPVLRRAALVADRDGPSVRVRDSGGEWQVSGAPLHAGDSMLAGFADPRAAPEVFALREELRAWRFYDSVRTDAGAPARAARIGTFTPVLASDGSDLAAALQTIREIGDAEALDEAVDRAFPGSSIEIDVAAGRFELALRQHGLLRPLSAAELSDGTLRYLLWTAALLSPRPAPLLVLNEPETSLHPDLLPALGRLLVAAAEDAHSQVVVVTHSALLLDAVRSRAPETGVDVQEIELVKDFGETRVAGQDRFDRPAWQWPKR